MVLALCVLVAAGLWKTRGSAHNEPVAVVRHCEAVMGTTCTLAVVVPLGKRDEAARLLRQAEKLLRDVEAQMSCWLEESEISRLNAAPPGQLVELSPPTREVLRAAQAAHQATGGAFDATCAPVLRLWRKAAQQQHKPAQKQLDAARAAMGWDNLDLSQRGAIKRKGPTSVDLGGIAKGYAIQRAAEMLHGDNVEGGLVDVGGDVACFGRPPREHAWLVEIQNPFGPGVLLKLRITGQAVCTSGNYARFFEIAGQRFSHIIDPRTGRPAEGVASATVVAADAMTADIWATALSVLGPEGFQRLPPGVEALLVLGTPDAHQLVGTPGMRELIEGTLPKGLEINTRYGSF